MITEFYGYKHWTLEEIPRCFNIGKGGTKRSNSRRGRNHKWHAIVKRYGFRVEVCVGPVTNEEACMWEIEQIVKEDTYTTNHSHDDIRCNFTKGGDGVSGWCHTEASRRKMKNSHTGASLSIDHSLAIQRAQKGRIKTELHCHRLSVSNMGKNKGKFVGEKHHAYQISDNDAIELRRRSLRGYTRKQLCVIFGVTMSVVNGLLSLRTYKHVLCKHSFSELELLNRMKGKSRRKSVDAHYDTQK